MKRDRVYLLHIRDAINRIADYTVGGNSVFQSDRKTQDAVIRNIEIIGEAVKNLSEPLRAESPEFPWKQIAGMRDRLIHHYFGVDSISSGKSLRKICPYWNRKFNNYSNA